MRACTKPWSTASLLEFWPYGMSQQQLGSIVSPIVLTCWWTLCVLSLSVCCPWVEIERNILSYTNTVASLTQLSMLDWMFVQWLCLCKSIAWAEVRLCANYSFVFFNRKSVILSPMSLCLFIYQEAHHHDHRSAHALLVKSNWLTLAWMIC